jgi:hypothetical protein
MINHENNGQAEDDPMDDFDQEFCEASPNASQAGAETDKAFRSLSVKDWSDLR